MIAAKNNFFEFATILLFEGADPTLKDVYGNKASQMTNNENLRIFEFYVNDDSKYIEVLNKLKNPN